MYPFPPTSCPRWYSGRVRFWSRNREETSLSYLVLALINCQGHCWSWCWSGTEEKWKLNRHWDWNCKLDCVLITKSDQRLMESVQGFIKGNLWRTVKLFLQWLYQFTFLLEVSIILHPLALYFNYLIILSKMSLASTKQKINFTKFNVVSLTY